MNFPHRPPPVPAPPLTSLLIAALADPGEAQRFATAAAVLAKRGTSRAEVGR